MKKLTLSPSTTYLYRHKPSASTHFQMTKEKREKITLQCNAGWTCKNRLSRDFWVIACSSTKTKTKTKAFVCSSMFWNKPVTKEPIILCNIILRAWFIRHRHYLEQTKTFVLNFVFVFVLTHEQTISPCKPWLMRNRKWLIFVNAMRTENWICGKKHASHGTRNA